MTQPKINKLDRDEVAHFGTSLRLFAGGSLDAYQHLATKSAIYPGQGTPFGLMYCALGLGEAGEVQNKVKKAFRDDVCITLYSVEGKSENVNTAVCMPLSPERRQQIIKELGGTLWYLAATAHEIGATLSEIALANLEEIAGRTERDTMRGDGDDR